MCDTIGNAPMRETQSILHVTKVETKDIDMPKKQPEERRVNVYAYICGTAKVKVVEGSWRLNDQTNRESYAPIRKCHQTK